MIGNQKHKVGTDPKFTGPDEIPLLPKFLSDQNPDQSSHYHLLLKEWWESVYENLNRIRDMVVNFQVADLKEGSEEDLTRAKSELSQLASELVGNLDDEIGQAIQSLEGTLTKSITDHIDSRDNPHGVTADDLNISTAGKTGDYGDLSNIPSEFPPSTHSHAYNTLTDIPNLFAPSAHNHDISDITNLSTTLDGKASKVSLGNIVPSNATTTADGLMSSSDKTKLDGMSSGGEIVYADNITWGSLGFTNLISSNGTGYEVPAGVTKVAFMDGTAVTKRTTAYPTYPGTGRYWGLPLPADQGGDGLSPPFDNKIHIISAKVNGQNVNSGAAPQVLLLL